MSDNLKRLNFKSKLISEDGRTYKFPEKQDIIIIDAPCSSTGTIRKNPDILIRNNIIDLTKLQRIQQELLINAASNIKVGGYLMYIVCSLEEEEGEDIAYAIATNQVKEKELEETTVSAAVVGAPGPVGPVKKRKPSENEVNEALNYLLQKLGV